MYIRNAKVVLENGILWDGVIEIENDRIQAVGPAGKLEIPEGAETVDAGGRYVGPGFVDIHVHGGNGKFFYQDPVTAAEHFLSAGETTILPTLYYDLPKADFEAAIRRIQGVMGTGGATDALRGFYMEGPYMNPEYGACSDKNQWRGPIRPEDYKGIVDLAGKDAKVWAIAPEREGLVPFMEYARKVNPDVRFSTGHSEASPAQIRRLKKYGLCMQTHCLDATGRPDNGLKGTRTCGPDEACFADDDIYAEMICDSQGIHVCPDYQRLILKVKGLNRTLLITDSYVSDKPSPEHLRYITDLVFDDNCDLNGSKLTMNVACRNIMTHTNCGIAQAFLLAARNPARAVGIDDEVGTIEAGKKANLVFVDDMFNVERVMLNGKFWKAE